MSLFHFFNFFNILLCLKQVPKKFSLWYSAFRIFKSFPVEHDFHSSCILFLLSTALLVVWSTLSENLCWFYKKCIDKQKSASWSNSQSCCKFPDLLMLFRKIWHCLKSHGMSTWDSSYCENNNLRKFWRFKLSWEACLFH